MDSALVESGKTADVTVMVVGDLIQSETDASDLVPVYSKQLVVEDNTAASISKIESETNDETADTVTITFSEPVTAGVIKIDGESHGSVTVGDETEITGLELDAATSHTLQIINLTDVAGNTVSTLSKTFTITTDADAPTVKSAVQYTDSSILVTFSESMDPATVTTDTFTLKDELLDDLTVSDVVADPADKDDVSFIVYTNASLYGSKTSRTLTLVVQEDGATDALGNNIDDVTKNVTLTQDKTAPTVTGVKVLKNVDGDVSGLEVSFNEAIEANASGYASTGITVVNKNGVNVTADINADGTEDDAFFAANSQAVELGDKKVVFDLATATDLNDEYTFTFAKGLVTDAAVGTNDSAAVTKSVDFGAASTDDFEIDAASDVDLTGSTITVDFGQEVKGGTVAGSATNIANYSLEGVDLSDAVITLDYTKEVATIDISNCDITKTDASAVFTIVNVKNADGVTIKPVTTTMSVADNVAPKLASARVLSATEIELTFNENMDITDGDVVTPEFEIKLSGTTLSAGDSGVIKAYAVPGYAKKVKLVLSGNTVDADAAATPPVVAVPFQLNVNKTITIKALDVADADGGNLVVDAAGNQMAKSDSAITVVKP